MEWILILVVVGTIHSGQHTATPVQVSSPPPFTTKERCEAAMQRIEADRRAHFPSRFDLIAVCAPR